MKAIRPEHFFLALVRIESQNITKPYFDPIMMKSEKTNSNSLTGLYLLNDYYEKLEKDPNRSISALDLQALKSQYTKEGVIACAYCGEEHSPEEITFDHFIPFYLGGLDTFNNLKFSCESCNLMKGSIHPKLMPLTWSNFQRNIKNKVTVPAIALLEESLKLELSQDEKKLAQQLHSKELQWREKAKEKAAQKKVDDLDKAC